MPTRDVIFNIIGRESVSPAASKAAASMEAAASRISRASDRMVATGTTLTHRVSLPLIAIGAASVAAAADFNASMTRIQTQAGGSAKDVATLTKAVLNMKNVQQGPQQLADSLYHLKSVGMDNVAAMKALRQASDLAAVGGASLEDTVNALAGAWRTGIQGAKDFHGAVATINAIIGAGNMTLADFNEALGTGILPTAKTFGLTLKDVGSALALFTDEGVPAANAATRLRMSMSLLGAPSAAAEKQLSTIGLTGLKLAQDMRKPNGLITAIGDLKDHLDKSGLSAAKQAQLLSHAFGGGRSSSAILSLVNNYDVLLQKQQQVDRGISKFNQDVAAQRQTPAAEFHMLIASLERTAILIGQDVLPAALKLAGAIGDVTSAFDKLPSGTRKFIVEAGLVAAAIGPVLLVGGKLIRVFAGAGRALTFPSRVLFGWGVASRQMSATGTAATTAGNEMSLATRKIQADQLAQEAAVKQAAAQVALAESEKANAAMRTAESMQRAAMAAGGAEAVLSSRAAVEARAFAAAKAEEAEAAVKSAATITVASNDATMALGRLNNASVAASRQRIGSGVGMGLAFGAIMAGQATGGKSGNALTAAGTGALVGSAIMPGVGTAAGAVVGLGDSLAQIGNSKSIGALSAMVIASNKILAGLSTSLKNATQSSEAFKQAQSDAFHNSDYSGLQNVQQADKIVSLLPPSLQSAALNWDKYKTAFDAAMTGHPAQLRLLTSSLLKTHQAAADNVPTMKSLANVADFAGRKILSLSDAISGLDHGMVALVQSNLNFKLGLKDLHNQLAKHNKDITGDTKAALDNRLALVGLIGQIKDHASAMQAAGKHAPEIAKQIDSDVRALEQTAINAGVSRKAFDALIKQMHLTPKDVKTKVVADTTSAATKVRTLQQQLNAIANGSYVAHVTASGNINITGTGGGPIYAGHIATGTGSGVLPQGWAWVGDPGPQSELTHTTPRGTQVFSAPESRRMAATMGIPVPNYATGTTSGGRAAPRKIPITLDAHTIRQIVAALDGRIQEVALAEVEF